MSLACLALTGNSPSQIRVATGVNPEARQARLFPVCTPLPKNFHFNLIERDDFSSIPYNQQEKHIKF